MKKAFYLKVYENKINVDWEDFLLSIMEVLEIRMMSYIALENKQKMLVLCMQIRKLILTDGCVCMNIHICVCMYVDIYLYEFPKFVLCIFTVNQYQGLIFLEGRTIGSFNGDSQ